MKIIQNVQFSLSVLPVMWGAAGSPAGVPGLPGPCHGQVHRKSLTVGPGPVIQMSKRFKATYKIPYHLNTQPAIAGRPFIWFTPGSLRKRVMPGWTVSGAINMAAVAAVHGLERVIYLGRRVGDLRGLWGWPSPWPMPQESPSTASQSASQRALPEVVPCRDDEFSLRHMLNKNYKSCCR